MLSTPQNTPHHVAIIMDGNGRWAQNAGYDRIYGHQHALTAVHDAIECAGEQGIQFLTLYAFSTENWNRPQEEVNMLMSLFVQTIHQQLDEMHAKNVRLLLTGRIQDLPADCQEVMQDAIRKTADNTGLTVILSRTGGVLRVSNFLLWQIAYTELFFLPVLWPDFRKHHLLEVLQAYQNRERRFGKTCAQISQS